MKWKHHSPKVGPGMSFVGVLLCNPSVISLNTAVASHLTLSILEVHVTLALNFLGSESLVLRQRLVATHVQRKLEVNSVMWDFINWSLLRNVIPICPRFSDHSSLTSILASPVRCSHGVFSSFERQKHRDCWMRQQ